MVYVPVIRRFLQTRC